MTDSTFSRAHRRSCQMEYWWCLQQLFDIIPILMNSCSICFRVFCEKVSQMVSNASFSIYSLFILPRYGSRVKKERIFTVWLTKWKEKAKTFSWVYADQKLSLFISKNLHDFSRLFLTDQRTCLHAGKGVRNFTLSVYCFCGVLKERTTLFFRKHAIMNE